MGSMHNPVYLAMVPTLNTLSKAKHPYNSPTGYATKSRWSDIRNTATKIPEAAYVHHRMEVRERRYPTVPLNVGLVLRI